MENVSKVNKDRNTFLHKKNLELISALAPTIAYTVVLMVIGLVGNAVVFLVYYRRFKPSVTRTYILAMSVCDFMTNVLVLPAGVVRLSFYYTFEAAWFCQLILTVTSLIVVYAGFLLLAVAVGRYRVICRPTLTRNPSKEAYVALAVCGAVSVVLTVPSTLSHGARTVEVAGTNITGTTCWVSDSYTDSTFLDAFNAVMAVLVVGCSLAMLTLYALIARRLWLHKKYNVAVGGVGGKKNAGKKSGSDDMSKAVRLQRIRSLKDQPINETSESSDNLESTATTTSYQDESAASAKNSTKNYASQASTASETPTMSTKRASLPAPKVKKIPARTTLMLFVLTAVFVLNYLPQAIVHTVFQQGIDMPLALEPWALNLFHIGLKSYYINSAINCVIYCFCSARFRHECRNLFRDVTK
ncbi:orexin/Hypocretin receptor type 1-like [Littorina saxatilis]|uniref:G-protein coupled receptors family 1 profile domain-containing protein n=1 Tax=Littorina saxatilis TaxID=31220 RepID=A0AAN9BBS7_9CAEN